MSQKKKILEKIKDLKQKTMLISQKEIRIKIVSHRHQQNIKKLKAERKDEQS